MESYNPLKVISYTIGFQEVPNETSLILNISGCPYKCRGCHSDYLWEDKGDILNEHSLNNFMSHYNNYITCICFMGGDWSYNDIKNLSNIIHNLGIKVCLYSGNSKVNANYFSFLDYYKVGNYNETLGGLDNINTNQVFYKIENKGKIITDITYEFQKKGLKYAYSS